MRADVFFYGLFLDAELLRAEGYAPQNPEIAFVEGFKLRIGRRAALAPAAGSRVYGSIMSLTVDELERLYAAPSLTAYKPTAVLAYLARGGARAALCYNLSEPPQASERNEEYAKKLRVAARKVGLPQEYLEYLDGEI